MKRVIFLLAALTTPLLAEPNFTGSWTLNLSESQYGQVPAPQAMLRSIIYSGGVLTMSTYQKSAQGEASTELTYTTDGKTSINGENRGTARWQGDTLIIESSMEAQGATFTQQDRWTLSPDGKTLTIASHVKLPSGEYDVKQVFEKVPGVGGTRANF